MDNQFNLIDESWIPVADLGRVSLRQVFTKPEIRFLAGNPVQKIALLKLLLAIAQSAFTPRDEAEWQNVGEAGLAERCLVYLDNHYDKFFLFGNNPFLQMPEVSKAVQQPYSAVLPEIATGNTTVLSQIQLARDLSHADKALLLVVLMGFALGGKKTDNRVVLSPGYQGKSNDKGKPATGKPGPCVAHLGLLHSFLLAPTLRQSLWLNLLTEQDVAATNLFPMGLGIAPWEKMPAGENCSVAQRLKQSLLGRLIPLCRFCLLTDQGLHYSQGLTHGGYKEGISDLSTAIDYSSKEPRALWVNPEKRPWRELSALLSVFAQKKSTGFQSWQLNLGLARASGIDSTFVLWSGGLRVSSNAGEQYVSGSDDFVESQVYLHSSMLGEIWFAQLQAEMTALDDVAKVLYGCVMGYCKELIVDGSKFAAQATQVFWQMCERQFQNLVDHCEPGSQHEKYRRIIRLRFADYVQQAYDNFCSDDTARQLDAWAKCRPHLGKYLKQEN